MPNTTLSTEEKIAKKERVIKDIRVSILKAQKCIKGLERSLNEVLAFMYEDLRVVPRRHTEKKKKARRGGTFC